MHEWELFPQYDALHLNPHWFEPFIGTYKTALNPDVKGLIVPTAPDIEGDALRALEMELGKKVFGVGPQFPPRIWEPTQSGLTASFSDDDRATFAFLDQELKRNGPKSVVYISFGSLFWPVKRPELLRFIIQNIPSDMTYLLSDAAAMSSLESGEQDLALDEKRGKVVKFVPQWKVLNHPAVGIFVSHMGITSMYESILSETLTLAIPFLADQAEAADIMSKRLGISIEIEQFRSTGIGKTRYSGVQITSTEESIRQEMVQAYKRTRGDEGEEMMERLKGVKDGLVRSWRGGESFQGMEEFGRMLR